jgi:hypothetical protein
MGGNPKFFSRVAARFFLEATTSDQKREGETIRRWYQRYFRPGQPIHGAVAEDVVAAIEGSTS